MGKIQVQRIRKTGQFVAYGGNDIIMPKEHVYIFGIKVGDIIYKCFYASKDYFTFQKGDYAIFEGKMYKLRIGFSYIYNVLIDKIKVISVRDLKADLNNDIFIANYRMRGIELPLEIQNGFFIERQHDFMKYSIEYVRGYNSEGKAICDNVGRYKDQFTLREGSLKIGKKYSKNTYQKMVIIDYHRDRVIPFTRFYEDITKE